VYKYLQDILYNYWPIKYALCHQALLKFICKWQYFIL